MNLEAEYDNRSRVSEHPVIIAQWKGDAARFRAATPHESDVAYGERPRQRVDIFPGSKEDAPVAVFVHGGYWRAFDKSFFSHMAAGVLAHGMTVAVPSYTLCPEIGVLEIVDELRALCLFLHRRTGHRLVVAGHSAGGHLAASMAATDWESLGGPADLIVGGSALSGLFDLRPLLATTINQDLRLDAESAAAASPLLWPVDGRFRFALMVGGDESAEFQRQTFTLEAAWKGLGIACDTQVLAKLNHFNIVSGLAEKYSPLTRTLVDLCKG